MPKVDEIDIEIVDEETGDVYFYDDDFIEEIIKDIPGYLEVKKIYEDWNEIAP